MDIDIWVIGTLNQLFRRGSYTQIKSLKKKNKKKKISLWKNPVLCDKSIFLLPILFILTLTFDRAVLNGNLVVVVVVVVVFFCSMCSTKKWYSSFSRKIFVF